MSGADQYFGQPIPVSIPEVFAPGVITDAGFRLHGFPAFSQKGDEVFWPVLPPVIMCKRFLDDHWTAPETASFSGRAAQAPLFSPDGNRIYFQAAMSGGLGSLDIWYTERTDSGWGVPVNPGAPLNSPQMEGQPSLTADGTIYFFGSMEGSGWNRGIYRCSHVNGQYQTPERLPEPVNTAYVDVYPFVSRDERFLLFSSSRPGMEEKDLKLFLSIRNQDGSWETPVNLSEKLELKGAVRYGALSPDGRVLFFMVNGKIFWVSADILNPVIRQD